MTTNARVFISYSRRNLEFARRLFTEISKDERDVWVDWEDIPRAADWLQEIYAGIDNADTFIFLVSEHALTSEVCNQELAYALKQNKRVIPLILQRIENAVYDRVIQHWQQASWQPTARANWEAVKHLNWIFFDEPARYDAEFEALLEAIDQDLYHIKTHTRLLVRAREWEAKARNASSLLAGDDITTAEHWLQTYRKTPPLPTDLHREFIMTSRQIENKKLAQQAALQRQARQRLQILVASFVLIIIATIVVVLPLINNSIIDELGDSVDERLTEAATSFGYLIEDDLALAELAAEFIASRPESLLVAQNDADAFAEFDEIRRDFRLQELSLYPADYTIGMSPIYYNGPERSNLNERVIRERGELIQQVIREELTNSRVILGTPESQIMAAVPIFSLRDGEPWNLLGVVIAAYHLNDEYVVDRGEMLNVEAAILNFEEQVVASTLSKVTVINTVGAGDNTSLLVDGEINEYFDYETEAGDVLRMVSTQLIVDDEARGFLLVARSFEDVLGLQAQVRFLLLAFAGGISVVTIILLIVLVGIPALRNRREAT